MARTAKKSVAKGKRMTRISKYEIVPKAGKRRKFTGTLLKTFNLGNRRIAIFSVPKAM